MIRVKYYNLFYIANYHKYRNPITIIIFVKRGFKKLLAHWNVMDA